MRLLGRFNRVGNGRLGGDEPIVIKNAHPAIIDKKTFKRVQAKRSKTASVLTAERKRATTCCRAWSSAATPGCACRAGEPRSERTSNTIRRAHRSVGFHRSPKKANAAMRSARSNSNRW
ncbi:recombinase family protein [Rubripirellula obstinata]|uniref:recombinase family protein n=1 Tax=Rubripirellula obstinata TaxID=406547 RepID=UPI003B834F6A